MTAARAQLAPGRWHFQHGPIDLVIGAEGDARAIDAAREAAWARFQQLLPELVAELAILREPVSASREDGAMLEHGAMREQGAQEGVHERLRGPVARRMRDACLPFARTIFVTPMAAVAGSVAQEIVACFERGGVLRAWVNNGGDIALHLAPGERLRVAVCADPRARDRALIGRDALAIDAADRVRGIATSGWRGRSLSLGIADAVTVLAATAAQADVAATLIANAVNVDDPSIRRLPANRVRDDSDLGARAVTVEVGQLPASRVEQALDSGAARAREFVERGLIAQALLSLSGRSRIVTRELEMQP